MNSKIQKIKCAGDEEWQALRQKAIGGSDAGTILGLNPFQSAYSLWCEKTGAVEPEDISGKESVRLGNDLEQYVAERFVEATGKKVRKVNYTLINPDYPFAHANIDRDVVGEDAGLECKTTSSWEILQQCREGNYPAQWYCQIMHYMMVTEYNHYYLAVIVLGQGFYWFEIKRDEAEIEALKAAEMDFWAKVEAGIPPEVDGSEATLEALKTLYPDSSEDRGSIDLSPVAEAIGFYNAAEGQIKELTAQRDRCKAQIMEFMQDAPKGTLGNITVTYRTQTRSSFDRVAYERDHGVIPDTYYTRSTSRPFKITVKK